jgi:hypothetical protein
LIYYGGWEAQKLRKYRILSVKFGPLPIQHDFWTSSVSRTRVPTIHGLDTFVGEEIALNMCWGEELPRLRFISEDSEKCP